MSVYLITYDLNKPVQDYDDLFKKIQSLGDWNHFMKSNWFVSTSQYGTEDIQKELLKILDQNDFLFITRLISGYHGWLPQETWDWLTSHM
ncbi:hypothetical protein [Sporolactobacillus pectinivorans]|uniref:hypothetical protein n=1 Tax=Sporolactobacillus pectinivorans TaxID=1591408 RepID=UPI000C25F9AE|nr:hypothetical protein [Sporolactobacillus pectinivorans]